MADELRFRHEQTGETLYALLFVDDPDSDDYGEVWDGVAGEWAAFAVADLGDYDVALAEDPAGSYRYLGDFPAAAGFGFYTIEIYVRGGAAPAITDELLAEGRWHYDGSVLRATDKTLEQLLAREVGRQTHVAATGTTVNYGRDGTTELIEQVQTGGGNRNEPTLS